MRKYWAIIKINLHETLAYRGPMLIWLMGNTISAVVMATLWGSAQGNNLIGGYLKSELITYYILSLFLSWVVLWYPFDNIFKQIRDGQIVLSTLIKPTSCFLNCFLGEIGWHLVSSVVGSLMSLILFYFFRNQIFISTSLLNLIFFPFAVILAIFVTFILSLNMALLAFWFTQVSAIESFFWIGRSILGGATIPLSFLPDWAKKIVIFLPFRYLFSFPLEILFNKVNLQEICAGLLIGTIWAICLYFLYKYEWERGRKVYSAFGH